MTRIAFSEATNLAVAGDKFCSSPPRICRTAFLRSIQELNVEIPLNLTEATIGKQVKRLIRNQASHEMQRGSSAKRPLCGALFSCKKWQRLWLLGCGNPYLMLMRR
jgi:hypothetical protein